MLFPPDIGFVIQIAAFLFLWWILKRWLFDPTLRVLDLRRERTAQPLAEAERLRRETEAMRAKLEASIEAARVAAQADIEQARREAEAEEERILAAARAEASEVIGSVRERVRREVEVARGTMARYAAEISVEAAAKILGRPVR